jgi:hypothetical protein
LISDSMVAYSRYASPSNGLSSLADRLNAAAHTRQCPE